MQILSQNSFSDPPVERKLKVVHTITCTFLHSHPYMCMCTCAYALVCLLDFTKLPGASLLLL